MASIINGSDFLKWVSSEKTKINGRLCEMNLGSPQNDHDVDHELPHGKTTRVVTLQYRHSGISSYARGYDNVLEFESCLQYGFFETYFRNYQIISNRRIENVRIFPIGYYEQTVTTALSESGMPVKALSDLILSYLLPIFDPSDTEPNADAVAEPTAESNFWNKCNIL